VLRENILAMKAIWTQDEAEFHGEYVNFDKIWSYPKPVQQPHPPIFMGGDGPTTFDRVVEFCDGWMPIGGRQSCGPSLAEKIALLKRQAREAGRDPDSLPVTLFGVRPDPELVSRMEQDGVSRILFSLPSAQEDTLLPMLDNMAALIR
jgi:alkanesulfonate monooxygenase SsuD/methylene tetrahydromethanopterin reductase-like flavin-dependent oxidoreductase (luciferase family)